MNEQLARWDSRNWSKELLRSHPGEELVLDHSSVKTYISGLLALQRDDDTVLQRQISVLKRKALPASAEVALAAALERALTAQLAWRGGKVEASLTALDKAFLYPEFFLAVDSPILSQVLNRWLRAEALFVEERYSEALSWYETVPSAAFIGAPYLGPSFLRRAEIYERLGESQRAKEFYQKFIDLWEDCDPELRHWVEDARVRLKRLR